MTRALDRELPGWLTGAVVGVAAGVLAWLERRRPLRRPTEDAARRERRNLAMAALAAVAVRATERPVTRRLSRLVDARRWGVVKRPGLPAWVEVLAGVVLLDYTLFVWHVLTHEVPLLARFHEVHHADRDLSASTAVRFHFGEMVLSVPWRAAQVVVVGASPLTLSVWQLLTLVAILFHHANVRLPIGVERRLCRLVTTPRMHGIHHSVVLDETNANWSTIFSWPDYLHGTARLDVAQASVRIGAPTVAGDGVRTLPALLARPFVAGPRPDVHAPSRADRTPGAPRTRLLA
jgi:sterol desaturase/sphingolipid hydroxylase (fatty acid hydroxylase superfamily)